ncbi:uncharacterized protein LOC124134609 [Haliotis rufescens]|uniref:uncharacterized protein LOC124134609 n=1 Tax=Haliotis rufescens TaxID=6454 RepID=UPI00201EB818|nr:uncharacterized protein LOC124134609 [Haliotis rufescens]
MEGVLLFALLPLLTNAFNAGRYQVCREGWTTVNNECYRFVEEEVNRQTASDRCRDRYGATLAVIMNKEQNKAVQDLIDGHRNAWIGLHQEDEYFRWDDEHRNSGYTNWKPLPYNHYGKRCTRILDAGFWQVDRCREESPYVCSKIADCELGWTGYYCDRECHCYPGYACNGSEACPYGCEPGYTGKMCDDYLDKTTVSFYCMKQRGGGYSLMVSFDWPARHFRRIGAVDDEGEISPHCTNDRFDMSDRWQMHLHVQIKNVSGVWEPDCPAETVGKGILQWTFRLQKKEGIVSFEDEELQVQCDLSEADILYDDSESVEVEENRVRPLTVATQTRVNVRTYLAYPDTLEPVKNLTIGVPVRLMARLPEGDDVVNPLFYPWSCQAASPDGKVTVQLTDDSGCSLNKDVGFGRMDKGSGVIQSEIFPIFQLRGYSDVVFSCAFVPSLTPGYRNPVCVPT